MTDLVRVSLDNGYETTVGREHAEVSKLKILDSEPAVNGDGTVRPETRRNGRPVLPQTSVSSEARKKRGASAASDAEEATA